MTPGLDAPALEAALQPLVPDRLRAAVCERLLATAGGAAGADGAAVFVPDRRWPDDVALRDVTDWLAAHAPDPAAAAHVRAAILAMEIRVEPAAAGAAGTRAVVVPPRAADLADRCVLAAHAFQAWRAIQHDLRRPALAVDAGRPHHDLVAGMRDQPKDRRPRRVPVDEGRVEIIAPDGGAVRLSLALDAEGGLHKATIETLRQWRGWEGVRHWAALQRLFSVEGGRSGAVRWTLDAHLAALGYADRARRDPAVRRRVAREVELLTTLQLAVYAPDGRLRARQPLLAVGTKYDALRGVEWALEGMELRVNEWLYRGVRDPQTGALGSDWHPAPIEVAQIDHVHFPYAIVLGLILPIRWRWDLGARDHCALTGATLLATAGIRYTPHNPARAWESLRRNLDELQRHGGLGRYACDDAAWTLASTLRLYPPQWARERTLHRLVPEEKLPPPAVATGAELAAWRRQRGGLSQAAAARALGVGVATLKRAEANPTAVLGRALRDALARAP